MSDEKTEVRALVPRKKTRRHLTPEQKSEYAAKVFEQADRRREVAKLIAMRYKHREIAEILKISPSTVQADKDAIMAEWAKAMIVDIGESFLASAAMLDLMQQSLMPKIEIGSEDAIALSLQIEKRRAAMMGFDARDRMNSGMRILPAEDVEAQDDEILTPDGRPIGKGDAARIYAAFAPENPPAT